MKNLHNILVILVIIISSCSSTKLIKTQLSYSNQIVDKPTIFAEGILSNKDRNIFNICFTPDGNTAYFTLRKGNEKQKIYFSQFKNKKWTEPAITSFSTDRDEAPNITPDGKTIYFGSQRPVSGRENKGDFDMNIWKTNWVKGKWSEPMPLSETINKIQIEKEEWPSSNETGIFTKDGINYHFATMLRGTKTIEIYNTQLVNDKFSEPVKMNGLFDNDKYWKSTPIISPDGNYLVFNAYDTPLGKGGEDIYISKKTENGWTKAKSIGELINTKAEEASARFSKDGKYFFFAREFRENPDKDGIWSIYFIETKYLNLENLFNN